MSVWDRLATSNPLNKTAAIVTSQHRDAYVPQINKCRETWETPPPCLPIPATMQVPSPVGRVYGRMRVIGYLGSSDSNQKAKWLVRCSCGRYESRSYKAIHNPLNAHDLCSECMHTETLRKRAYSGTGQAWG